MLTWTVDHDIEERLESLGAATEESKTALLRQAAIEMLEEREDVRMAESVLAAPGRRYSLEEVEREFERGPQEDRPRSSWSLRWPLALSSGRVPDRVSNRR